MKNETANSDFDSFAGRSSKERDVQIDVYRGLIMIYIICVVHVAWWLQMLDEPWRSLLLFEMPVIFFLSGATMYVTDNRHPFRENLLNRSKRVLIPYYIYAAALILCCIFIAQILPDFMNGGDTPIRNNIVNILLIQEDNIRLPYIYHLWFIIPFLIISCSFSVQQRWAYRCGPVSYIFIILLICATLYLIPSFEGGISFKIEKIFRECMVYNFFFMAGYLFYKRLPLRKIGYVCIASAMLLIIFYAIEFALKGSITSMQLHKFPPDFIFLLYGTFSISFLALIFGKVNIPSNRIIQYWNHNGYTLFLWQNFSFWGYLLIINHLRLKGLLSPGPGNALITATGIFLLSTLTSLILKFIGNSAIRAFNFLSRLSKKS